MWFWFSLFALVCWSFSDLFSKLGCADPTERYSYLRMTSAVGLVMGLHAAYELLIGKVPLTLEIILTYLPVSALYISSMIIGYLGLRYIELSVSSPVCNSSGALTAILALCIGGIGSLVPLQLAAVAMVCIGVTALGVVEAREDDALRAARQEHANFRYAKSFLALLLPVIYCLLDAAGTYADSLVLETLDEASANVAYELTFFVVGAAAAVYTRLIRRDRSRRRTGAARGLGAVFETAGQLAYIYAIGDGEHLALSAPMISAYCAVSVLWGRLFLKERLSGKHYAAIGVTVVGIIFLGIFDP